MTTPKDVGSPPDGGADHDDAEALSWGAEQDATYVDAPANELRAPRAPRARTGDEPLASGSLVGLGVLGGVYLLYTVAWLVSAGALPVDPGTSAAAVFSEGLRVLAIMAPALWFAATLWLGQGRRPRTRVLWLVAGALVLFPWPFVLTRSFG
ncbi:MULTISPECIES: hypothetical protein [unclassified Curtobacterium]|uniref:hypothetical protein n=1 Tax=unclassified Curtobacterium TaxID=257496 RepID=UPI000DA89260|nr:MULTISPECIES: hypothetical protein [unclassified Curtobacterium]PZE23021.1 hypothetical protein DEI86_15825 [Curtobacterium sp. MCBD17_028]PZF58445.1 hypothetical protein DEI92_10175 [Curtobacterium sp. MCBD17_034]PZF64498.1 hypothetical protein DEI81_06055 [Curtobacterium sp. MCBD17_013]PZM34434.1 hypothetical protein DEI90_06745 [Curtobacterium sp. MCBD17_031]WIB62494.1 hypothetical protein DEI94_09905 [Curtobacterium sp. MCBD17_040]